MQPTVILAQSCQVSPMRIEIMRAATETGLLLRKNYVLVGQFPALRLNIIRHRDIPTTSPAQRRSSLKFSTANGLISTSRTTST
jgi:hypothetical protein